MNKIYLLIFCSLSFMVAQAQSLDSLFKTANGFIMKGDAQNALMVLNKAKQIDPDNNETKKLIAFTYFNQRDFAAALPYANELARANNTDFQQVQMAGLVFKAIAMYKEAEQLYKNAIIRFPENGVLLSEYGELMYLRKKDKKAIELWEQGIKLDPQISANYYFASKYYSETQNYIPALLYAEVFLNLESFSERSVEVKQQLINDYKSFFSNIQKFKPANNDFLNAVYNSFKKFSSYGDYGITPSSLHKIRVSFIQDWNESHESKFPFKLFSSFNELRQFGLFEAYNHWLLSTDVELRGWATENKEAFNNFLKWQNNKVFKIPVGQYYLQ